MNLALHRSLDKLYKQSIKSHIRTCVGRLAPCHPACGRPLGAAAPALRYTNRFVRRPHPECWKSFVPTPKYLLLIFPDGNRCSHFSDQI